MSLDFFVQSEIAENFKRISEIRKSGIFNKENIEHPLFKSALIEAIICLRDLMYKCEEYASRIFFVEDIIITDNIKDITDLITFVRDALCHIHSHKHKFGTNIFTYNIVIGKNPNAYSINGISRGCDYEDDMCFLFGEQKIYMLRHIGRVYDEAKKLLIPLLDKQFKILLD